MRDCRRSRRIDESQSILTRRSWLLNEENQQSSLERKTNWVDGMNESIAINIFISTLSGNFFHTLLLTLILLSTSISVDVIVKQCEYFPSFHLSERFSRELKYLRDHECKNIFLGKMTNERKLWNRRQGKSSREETTDWEDCVCLLVNKFNRLKILRDIKIYVLFKGFSFGNAIERFQDENNFPVSWALMTLRK